MNDVFNEFVSEDDNKGDDFDEPKEYSYDILRDNNTEPSYNPQDNAEENSASDVFLEDNSRSSVSQDKNIGPTIDEQNNADDFLVSTKLDDTNNPSQSNSGILYQQENNMSLNNAADENRSSELRGDLSSPEEDNKIVRGKYLKRKYSYIIVGILALMLISAGTIFATEMGANTGFDKIYNLVGLEKIWGGLPANGKIALASTLMNMSEVKSVHFENKTKIEAKYNSEISSPLQTFLKNKANFALETSQDGYVLGTDNSDSSTSNRSIGVNITASGDYQKDKIQAKIILDSSLLNDGLAFFRLQESKDNSITVDFKEINDKFYLRIPIASVSKEKQKDKWIEFNRSGINSYINEYSATNLSNKNLSLLDYSKLIKTATRVGTETINGYQTVKYKAEIDVEQLYAYLGSDKTNIDYESKYSPNITIYYWVSREDRLIHKFALSLTGKESGSEIKINFETTLSKFNKSFNIEAPEAEEIETEGFGGLLEK